MEAIANDREPYDRQPFETDTQWTSFQRYRDAGCNRSFDLFGEFGAPTRIKHKKWAHEWLWAERCAEWDREKDKVYRETALNEVKECKKRHIRLARGLTKLAEDELTRWLIEVKDPDSKKLNIGRLMQLIEVGIKLERSTLLEEPDINVNINHVVAPGDREQLMNLVKNPETVNLLDQLLEIAIPVNDK